jgi:putative nucleotidyltransferase with HDIG domain
MVNSIRSFIRLPSALRSYLLVWYIAGLCALSYSVGVLSHVQWRTLAWYIVASIALSVKTVRGSSSTSNGRACVSMASAAAFAAIIGVCPVAGAIVEVGSTAFDSVFPRRRALYQALFNISVVSTGVLGAGLVYHALRGPTMEFGQWSPLSNVAAAAGPMLIATAVYFLVNTLAVAEVVALASEVSFADVWWRNFRSTFVGYATGGACSIVLLGLSGHLPVTSLLLLCAPIIYASYSREQSDEARILALEKGKERLQGMYMASIRTLALTVAAKDPYTSGHIHRVTLYAVAIGRRLGFSEDEMTDLETGALLHDIGKIGVPETILTKPGGLDAKEMALMRRHSEIGWAILEPLEFPEVVKQIVRNHHEWSNGSGYPDGIAGDEIPLMVRIVSIGDVYDALTTDRPYRPAMTSEEARRIMWANAGTQFHPATLKTFFDVLNTIGADRMQASPSTVTALSEVLSSIRITEPTAAQPHSPHATTQPAPSIPS